MGQPEGTQMDIGNSIERAFDVFFA